MARVFAFVSNRGGVGKSSLSSQLAVALAEASPNTHVLLLDMSIHADASRILLGGAREPYKHTPGVRTRGDEVLSSIDPSKIASGFIAAAIAAVAPAARAPATTSYFGGWRGSSAPAQASQSNAFEWTKHCVEPAALNPEGLAPANLHVAAGGPTLHGDHEFHPTINALKAAFASMRDVVVLVDTDAELNERGASLAGIAAAQKLLVVLSSSWYDMGRLIDDKANGLFAALKWMRTVAPDCAPKIHKLIFNGLQKRTNAASALTGVPNALPFTPPSSTHDAVAEIAAYVLQHSADDADVRASFADADTLANVSAFVARYVTGMQTVPESTWQQILYVGCGVTTSPAGDPAIAAAQNVAAIANSTFF